MCQNITLSISLYALKERDFWEIHLVGHGKGHGLIFSKQKQFFLKYLPLEIFQTSLL